MLLIKFNGIFPTPFPLPASFTVLAAQTYILADASLSDYTSQQISDYSIKEITDAGLITNLSMNNRTIHSDGTVRLYGTGENWLGEVVTGADLSSFLIGARYIAKLNAAINYTGRFDALSTTESKLEQATWSQQQAEAAAYLADNNASTPLLSLLAAARNLTVAQYAQNVVNASAAYSTAVNALVTELKTQYQIIDSSETPQALKDTGWL